MKLLIDHADIQMIKQIYETYPVDGVTTNPTILSRCKRKPFDVLKEIRDFLPKEAMLHVQVVSTKASDMVKEAHHIQMILGTSTYIKIPVTKEGIKAIQQLKKENVHVTGTIVLSPMQGFLAAKAGADYIAPYVNRMENYGFEGVEVTKKLHDMLQVNHFSCEILGASFKNVGQVNALANHGIGACTLAPEIYDNLICLDAIDLQVERFQKDFEELTCGNHSMREEGLEYLK